MRNAATILVLFALLLAACPAVIAGEQSPHLRSGVDIGYQIANFHYREPGVMKESGTMHGVTAAYTHHFMNMVMLRLEGEFLGGELEYDGRYSSGTSLTTDTEDWLLQGRALAGYDFVFEKWALTPFVGLGYRYWYDDIQATGGYEREIQYLYAPIGLETASAHDKWRWGVRGEYDLFLRGWVKSYLSQAVAGYNDPENDQNFGDGWGMRASIYAEYEFADGYSFGVEPYYRYWWVKNSEKADLTQNGTKIGQVLEPKNRTTIWGLKAMLHF